MVRFALLFALAATPALSRPEPVNANVNRVVQGNNAFAADLYQQLRGEPGNLLVSPFSITAAVAMTSAGARGDTLSEIEKALHLPPQSALHPGLGRLLSGYAKRKDLATANALFGQKGYPWRKGFLDALSRHYGATLREVNFATDPEQARRTINPWVERQTRDKIKDLLQRGVLNGDTRLVLVNAIYFQGDWEQRFPVSDTKKADFHVSATKKVTADLMRRQGKHGYHAAGDARMLELGYAGGDTSMVVILPVIRHGLEGLERGLTAERLTALLDGLKGAPVRTVQVALPKFTFTRPTALNAPLQALGMKKAFTPDADLSGMAVSDRLFVSAAVHKAHIEVDEKGTKAAAATAVVVTTTSAMIPQTFLADEPFLFLIRDKKTGLILFMGRVSDPTAK